MNARYSTTVVCLWSLWRWVLHCLHGESNCSRYDIVFVLSGCFCFGLPQPSVYYGFVTVLLANSSARRVLPPIQCSHPNIENKLSSESRREDSELSELEKHSNYSSHLFWWVSERHWRLVISSRTGASSGKRIKALNIKYAIRPRRFYYRLWASWQVMFMWSEMVQCLMQMSSPSVSVL
jgi:hypothetical protein